MTSGIFTTPYEQYKCHEGKRFTIIRKLDDSERDPEVGPMFLIRLETGEEIHAWPEEVGEAEIVVGEELERFLAGEVD